MRAPLTAFIIIAALAASSPAAAQETRFHADVRREANDVKESCSTFSLKALGSCVYTFATAAPFHVAFGSIAPQNGTGVGLAFVEHWTPSERWRVGWNADAVVAPSGSSRAGLYVKIIRTPAPSGGGIVMRRPGDAPPAAGASGVSIHEYPVINVYVQRTALETVPLTAAGDAFEERQTIAGANVVYPLSQTALTRALRMSAVVAVNGRFVDTSSDSDGLNAGVTFAQFEEGVRVKPSLLNGRVQLNYFAGLDQFVASSSAQSSFHRWTADLRHVIPIYRSVTTSGPVDVNGPNDCGAAVGSSCPAPSLSRDREGAVGFRLLASRSIAHAGSVVPFYFQPTLGGSDLNGQRLLSGYDDYTFRGANLFALQESIEHSVWGPIGVYLLAEQATLTPEGSGLTTADLASSFGVGLTLRAGGFPLVNVTFAWGGGGHHITATVDPTLLGSSPRPPLF